MAESLKTKGREELAALRKRVIRQYASDRINKGDHDKLIALLDQVEAHIIKMPEEFRMPRMKKID